MINLYDIGNNRYKAVSTKFGSREGSLRDVVQFMVFDLDMDYSDIEMALVNMNALDHDAADFGIFGGFILTFSTKGKTDVA